MDTFEKVLMDSYAHAQSWAAYANTTVEEAYELADAQVQLGYGQSDPRDLDSRARAEVDNYVAYVKSAEDH